LHIFKIEDGDSRNLEKLKNGHTSATVRPISAKFGAMSRFGRLEASDPVKFPHFENPRWRRPPS